MINDVAEEEESVSAARKSGLLGNKFKSGLCVDTHTSKRAKHELVYCSDYLRLPTTTYDCLRITNQRLTPNDNASFESIHGTDRREDNRHNNNQSQHNRAAHPLPRLSLRDLGRLKVRDPALDVLARLGHL